MTNKIIPPLTHPVTPSPLLCSIILCLLLPIVTVAAEPPPPVTHQVTGLFSPDREEDLREVVEKLPDIKLISIDFKKSEASFIYDAQKVFPNATPEQVIERFDNLLRSASRQTFGIKPLCTTPRDKLELIEIRVVGLDCKGCCLAAYEAIFRIVGVEQATASFKDGWVTAWIHPELTDRAALEDALKKKGVTLATP